MSYCTFEEFLACIEVKPKSSQVNNKIRAITLWQPWASLVALGLKKYETRSWQTKFRGKLLIHAACRQIHRTEIDLALNACYMAGKPDLADALGFAYPPYGCIVGIADLTDCQIMRSVDYEFPGDGITIEAQTELERTAGDWQSGRYAWKLENIKALAEPIPCKGKQGLWIPSTEIIRAVGGVQ